MKTTHLFTYISILLLLAVSFESRSQTYDICGGTVPNGYITISVNGNCGVNSTEISRTITYIDNMAPGSTITTCGDPAPAGWVTISVNGNCGFDNSYISRTIKKVEGYTAENTMTVCDSPAPAGWITTNINGNCGFDGSYISRTIERINDLPTGSELGICDDLPPTGWITKSVNGNCGFGSSYISRTIRKIEGMEPGAIEYTCGDLPPVGWITMEVNSNCGYNSSYIFRKIIKIDGLPSGTELNICDGLPPTDWVTTNVSGNCGLNSNYIARTIIKVTCMPVETFLTICGNDAIPNGWIVNSQNGSCGFNSGYNSRTIRKISGYPNSITISGPQNTNICSGKSVTLSASSCPGGTVNWSNGQQGASISVAPTVNTDYFATCTQGECTSPNSNTITLTVSATPGMPNSTGQTICAGKTATLTATGCAGTYQWYSSNASTVILAYSSSYTTPALNSSTSYYVSCTLNNCESTKKATPVTVTSTPNQPNSTGQTICAGKTATLTASGCGGTYKWFSSTTSTVVLASIASYTTPTLNSNTTYYVSCTVSNCESTRKATLVTVNATPAAPTAATSGTTICNGQSVTLTATGCGGTVTWSHGVSGSSILVGTTGTYAAKCTINGCQSVNSNIITITSGVSGAPDDLVLTGTATTAIRTANKTITSTQIIPMGVNTTYNAGKNITLNPPFNARAGSTFKVEIKGCGS